MEYAVPELARPYRVLVLAASTPAWYAAPSEERGRALDLLAELLERLQVNGARLVGSFDDDLFATGQPLSLPYSIYVLLDVDDLEAIVRMTHELRSSALGRMLRLEARIGRRLFVLEN